MRIAGEEKFAFSFLCATSPWLFSKICQKVFFNRLNYFGQTFFACNYQMPVDIWVSNVCLPQNTPGYSINSAIFYVKQQISSFILHFINFLMWSTRHYITMEIGSRPFSKQMSTVLWAQNFFFLSWDVIVGDGEIIYTERLSNQCWEKSVHVTSSLHLLSVRTSLPVMAYLQYLQESTKLRAVYLYILKYND